jgi:hypothetical protein
MNRFPEAPVVPVQCTAVLCCESGSGGKVKAGHQCPGNATRFHGHHPVCWLHKSAASNPDRVAPLEFVGEV